jgi:3-oxoacyl-[acyl-carrier-protein] synthase II
MLLWATDSVLQSAKWNNITELPVVLGTTCGAMLIGQQYYRKAIKNPSIKRGQAKRSVDYQVHRQGALIGQAFGFAGPVDIIQNACASGANAIGEAWERVRYGFADRILAGGYDALCEMVFAGFDSLQALSPTVCRPFDKRRDGLALGEGVAMFALETLDSANERGANILGEIIGYSAATDCHHLTQPHPEGSAALTTMTCACELANLSPNDIDYINAHGTGTLLNDASESASINRWLGECESRVTVSSTKASVGHLLGAAGAVEIAVCLMALNGQWIPPSIASGQPEDHCNFRIVNRPESRKLKYVLSNSFGFGGANATIILKRWE